MTRDRQGAILLIGPTGSGKTPLGGWLERHGWGEAKCAHFDFGEALRRAAAKRQFHDLLSDKEVAFLEQVLQSGRLLENETFYIAERILEAFMARKGMTHREILVLNGLPRHVDQAREIEKRVELKQIVHLVCPPEVAAERILRDTGGDRKKRKDDSLPEIRRKLDLFARRTLPLLDHYREKEVPIMAIPVTAESTADCIGKAFFL